MKNKKELIIYIILVILILLTIVYLIINKTNKEKDNDTAIDKITDIDTTVDLDNSDETINWDNYQTKDLTLTDSITITTGGIYNLSGTITDGMITVDTNDYVKLILNNVSITNSSGPAIYVKKAKTVIIYLSDNSNNYLEDGSNYSNYDEDINATIYSKDDLVFDGTGSLTVKANYQDGIVSKDDLKIINGNYTISSADDGIRGKDSVYIIDGNFDITSLGDGIKSTNTEDKDKGYILIENGTFNIDATLDGIQAETKLIIKNGNFTIKTGNGSTNSSKSNSNWGNWGSKNTTDTKSAKGLKAGSNIVIEDGTFDLDTSDDAIHSNNYVGIIAGSYTISSGDDGIHADTEIIIDNGNIDIKESYEGIEAAKITINNGDIKVVASDDGINVAGGSDSSSMNRPGANNYTNNTTNILTINDGNIYVNASGDGIDINGSGYIYRGTIIVDGPTSNGDGALDYDGELVVNGGSLIAAGSSGMVQGISSNSTQYNATIIFTSSYTNKKITITDENENTILEYTPTKTYQAITVSSSKLKKGTTYTIKIDNETYTSFTVSSISTTVGTSNRMNNGGNMPGNGENPNNGNESAGKPNGNQPERK